MKTSTLKEIGEGKWEAGKLEGVSIGAGGGQVGKQNDY